MSQCVVRLIVASTRFVRPYRVLNSVACVCVTYLWISLLLVHHTIPVFEATPNWCSSHRCQSSMADLAVSFDPSLIACVVALWCDAPTCRFAFRPRCRYIQTPMDLCTHCLQIKPSHVRMKFNWIPFTAFALGKYCQNESMKHEREFNWIVLVIPEVNHPWTLCMCMHRIANIYFSCIYFGFYFALQTQHESQAPRHRMPGVAINLHPM